MKTSKHQRLSATSSSRLRKFFFGPHSPIGKGPVDKAPWLRASGTVRLAFASVFGLLIFKDATASFGSIWGLQDSEFLQLVILLWTASAILLFAVSFLLKARDRTLYRPALSAMVFAAFWLVLLGRVSLQGFPPVGFSLSVLLAICALAVSAEFTRMLLWTLIFLRSYVLLSLLLSALVSILGLAREEKFGLKLLDFDYPLSGLASHPNGLAMAAALGFILEFSHKPSLSSLVWRGMFVIALGLTYSFGSSVALLAALGIVALVRTMDSAKKSKGLTLGIAVVLFSGAVTALMAAQGRLNSLSKLSTGRISLWESLLPKRAMDFFLGSGLSPFQNTFPNNAHNDLLQALSVGGLLALLPFFAAVALKLVELSRPDFQNKEQRSALLTFALVLGLVEVPMAPSFSVSLALILLLWFSRSEQAKKENEI